MRQWHGNAGGGADILRDGADAGEEQTPRGGGGGGGGGGEIKRANSQRPRLRICTESIIHFSDAGETLIISRN